jgi:bifunctional DNase/RNase
MTHDLLVSTIKAVGWSVARVVVTEVKNNTFYARIHLTRGDEEVSVDARPSDALNVAARSACPIYVATAVFESTDLVMKPISKDELTSFKEKLENADISQIFKDLEGRPAPKEN